MGNHNFNKIFNELLYWISTVLRWIYVLFIPMFSLQAVGSQGQELLKNGLYFLLDYMDGLCPDPFPHL